MRDVTSTFANKDIGMLTTASEGANDGRGGNAKLAASEPNTITDTHRHTHTHTHTRVLIRERCSHDLANTSRMWFVDSFARSTTAAGARSSPTKKNTVQHWPHHSGGL